ncbi:MAG: PD-(D/E)XK nuclease family protein, partial [Clostridia bacterium]|nr:PD-(D/E)XK nuclease family protein [Clostridia bacterium]
MSKVYVAPILSVALEKFKEVVRQHSEKGGSEGKRLIVFCEDRLSLVAERAVCEAVGGTFAVSVYTLSRFLNCETGGCENVLTSQGSAMAISKLIQANRENLTLFKRLSAANAAQEVYDTIALLYSSKISPDDLNGVETENKLLRRKLHDLELLYREYSAYLKECGTVDRNAYLRRLPDVIRASGKVAGADVVFLGFQAFTSSVADSVKACMETADNTYGIFIGGSEKKYVNEAWTAFVKLAEEAGLKRKGDTSFIVRVPSPLIPPAEHLRKYLFEPESFHKRVSLGISWGQLNLCEAADEEEECAFIASQILKCVREDKVRYREISVMLPDINSVQPALERAFGEYGVPFYVDRRYPLGEHSGCRFITDYLTCAADGCRMESVFAVVASPLFTVTGGAQDRRDKDVFVNYMLRAATFRGGVKKPALDGVCSEAGFDKQAVERVRERFIEGLKILPSGSATGEKFCLSVHSLLENFAVEKRLEELSENAEKCGYISASVMNARAFTSVLQVVDEAGKLTQGEKFAVREFLKILRSGFSAAEISLIPPRQDAVFVSDLSACANTGSKVLFIGGLTDAVPAASQDTAILTDGELTSLEKLKVAVSPKISQVNRRVREVTALNICSFSQKLYLSYPLRSGGEACGVSEAADYVKHLFTLGDNAVDKIAVGALMQTGENFAYACSSPAPALRQVTFYLSGDRNCSESAVAAVYTHLKKAESGDYALTKEETVCADIKQAESKTTADWGALYGKSISPTSLETYYSCPYKAFMQQGLRLAERREGAFRPLDSGNFIHGVLKRVAEKLNGMTTEQQCVDEARDTALKLMQTPQYAVQSEDAGGRYSADALVAEAQALAAGMYRQLKNSQFQVESVEKKCTVTLDCELNVGGRIDRVDSGDGMVRVIDYKTGSIDEKPASYYMGLKLQLPLYLIAAANGCRDEKGEYHYPATEENRRRAVGAYYFPASVD